MSMNPDSKGSSCCGGSTKPTSEEAQKLAKQALIDAKAEKSIIPPPQKPTTPQSKSKSCCD